MNECSQHGDFIGDPRSGHRAVVWGVMALRGHFGGLGADVASILHLLFRRAQNSTRANPSNVSFLICVLKAEEGRRLHIGEDVAGPALTDDSVHVVVRLIMDLQEFDELTDP